MITTLTGENDQLRQAELRRRTAACIAQYGDMAVERLDGEECGYERMLEAVQSLPFLTARRLVVLRKPSADEVFAERLETFIESISETNDVIIVEPKLDKRQTYYKQLKKFTEFMTFETADAHSLTQFAVAYAKEQGGRLSPADARFLVERTGAGQLALRHELDKLVAYDAHITQQSIALLTEKTPQSSIFELLDAACSGNTARVMALYAEQRALKVEPQQIVAMLAWQLHLLALAKTAQGRTPDVLAREARISPFTAGKAVKLARGIRMAQLKRHVTNLRRLDERSKTESIIVDDAVQWYLLSLAT